MSYSLNSFKGVNMGNLIGTTIGVIKGDTRSLDYGSYALAGLQFQPQIRSCTYTQIRVTTQIWRVGTVMAYPNGQDTQIMGF